MFSKLDPEAFGRFLEAHPAWVWKGDTIVREIEHPDFVSAIAYVNRVAEAAESMGHHPDIEIHYNKVTLRLSTHSEGAVTQRDLDLAGRLDAIP